MASSTVTISTVEIIGSRNWMAPERLLGGKLRKPSDIYALGMTIYEVTAIHNG
jgi:serine/threonine protein kinase